MPGGPDYPLDTSTRYDLGQWARLRTPWKPQTSNGNVVASQEEIRLWFVADSVVAARRELLTALAYLDLADVNADSRAQAVQARLERIEASVDALAAGAAAQQDVLNQIVTFLGVVVPGWHSLTEVHEGDEMGMTLLSAAEVGLTVEIVPLQREPGFAHEEVVRSEPAAGTLVARGSTVRVLVNLEG